MNISDVKYNASRFFSSWFENLAAVVKGVFPVSVILAVGGLSFVAIIAAKIWVASLFGLSFKENVAVGLPILISSLAFAIVVATCMAETVYNFEWKEKPSDE